MTSVDTAPHRTTGRFSRSLRAELGKIRATRGTRWALILTAALWVIVAVGVAAISLLVDARAVSLAGALLGMGAAVTVFTPILAILVMAGDWQSRDVMTTFALEPRRHIVFVAKALAAAIVCFALTAAAVLVAVGFTVALALVAGSAVTWDVDAGDAGLLIWGSIVGTVSGIAYGAAAQRAPLAIVFSLVQGFAIDPLLSLVPDGIGNWFRLSAIVDAGSSGGAVGPALVATILWLVVPLTIGVIRNQRTDVQ